MNVCYNKAWHVSKRRGEVSSGASPILVSSYKFRYTQQVSDTAGNLKSQTFDTTYVDVILPCGNKIQKTGAKLVWNSKDQITSRGLGVSQVWISDDEGGKRIDASPREMLFSATGQRMLKCKFLLEDGSTHEANLPVEVIL